MFFHRAFALSNQEASAFFGNGFLFFGVSGSVLGGWIGSAWLRMPLPGRDMVCTAEPGLARDRRWLRHLLRLDGYWHREKRCPYRTLLQRRRRWGQYHRAGRKRSWFFLRNVASTIGLLLGASFSVLSSVSVGVVSDHTTLRTAVLLVPAGFFVAGLAWVVLTVHLRRSRIKSSGPAVVVPSLTEPQSA